MDDVHSLGCGLICFPHTFDSNVSDRIDIHIVMSGKNMPDFLPGYMIRVYSIYAYIHV